MSRAFAAVVAVVASSWTLSAAALDRVGAIDVAKQQVGDKCSADAACTFTAKVEEGKWHVRVDFPKGAATRGKPTFRGHAIFIINQTGKIVGRVEGR